jgi:glycogen synthase
MKVLMLGWELPPHYVGGMGNVCDQLTKYLAKTGADIEFILPFKADYKNIKHMKVTPAIDQDAISLMQSGSTYDSMLYTMERKDGTRVVRTLQEQVEAFASNVARLVPLREFDVIHAHDWLTLRAAVEAKRISGMPMFVHIHATEYDRSGGNYGNAVIRDIEYIGLHMADHVFAVSELTKRVLMREYNLPADKISVTHNRMDVSFEQINETVNTYHHISKLREQGYKVVLNAGRITVQKGLTHLMNAMRIVISRNPKTVLLFVGSGEQISELLALSAELGIARNVYFTGRVDGHGPQWRDAFKVSDAYVMPSVSEPLGMVPFEAIAYGAPTICSKQSGIVEILTNTLKVDFWDIDKMASQILALLESPALHADLIENAQTEHKKLSWQPVADHILDRYKYHASQIGPRFIDNLHFAGAPA